MSRLSTLPAPTADCEGLDRGPVRTALRECRPANEAAVARATRDLLVALGADLDSEGLRETPRRMATAYLELLTPEPFNMTTFPNDEGYDELVVVRDIRFQSLCMHHVLPFCGVAHVGYLPADRIQGISKLARVVDLFARDLQLQERLTTHIAGWLQKELQPKGVGVVLEAEHLCMSLRGAQKPGAKTDVGMEYSGYAPHWDKVVFRGERDDGEFVAFWLQDDHVIAGMNVNVWDVNEHVQALIRSRQAVDVAALTDSDTPLESLIGQPAT
jgi:GTP cyclohydrolase IA